MFSGIVETCASVTQIRARDQVLELHLSRPENFDDLQIGDSVAVNGVCLTVEKFDQEEIIFTLADETLQITGWDEQKLAGRTLNVERSLRLSDRLHGHLVSGHVDTAARVAAVERNGESLWLTIEVGEKFTAYVWPKGSVAVNGVSLTINTVAGSKMTLCLVPETLRRTNLGALSSGELVNLEVDAMARGIVHWLSQGGKPTWN